MIDRWVVTIPDIAALSIGDVFVCTAESIHLCNKLSLIKARNRPWLAFLAFIVDRDRKNSKALVYSLAPFLAIPAITMKAGYSQIASNKILLSPSDTPGYTHAANLTYDSARRTSELLTVNHSIYHTRWNAGFHSKLAGSNR